MPLLTTRAGASSRAFGFGGASGGAAAMTAIATSTVSSGSPSEVIFNSIPSTYDDLYILALLTSSTGSNLRCQINGGSTSIYSNNFIYGDGYLSLYANNSTSQNGFYVNSNVPCATGVNDASTVEMDILNYQSSTTNKSIITRSAWQDNGIECGAGVYRSTSAVTSIRLYLNSGTFNIGTEFQLYGIKRA